MVISIKIFNQKNEKISVKLSEKYAEHSPPRKKLLWYFSWLSELQNVRIYLNGKNQYCGI
jgi:hypothetical protein